MQIKKIKKGTYLVIGMVLFMYSCTSENAENLYPTNDEAAEAFYESTLKSIIEEKCISCHVYHLEGTNRYDTYDKTKAAIGIMNERITKNDNTIMPPPEAGSLTEDEKAAFEEFIQLLNTSSTEAPKVEVQWTAYKYPIFDQRAGVSGSFKEVNFTLNENYTEPIDVLDRASVTIATESVTVGDEPERTTNVGTFFKSFTPTIQVTIISYTNTEATVAITMNQITEEITLQLEYLEKEELIELSGTIPDLSTFKWKSGYDALEEVCGEYHQNKVWPDIDIKAVIKIE